MDSHSEFQSRFSFYLRSREYDSKRHFNGEKGWYLSVSTKGYVKISGKRSSLNAKWCAYKMISLEEKRESDELNQALAASLLEIRAVPESDSFGIRFEKEQYAALKAAENERRQREEALATLNRPQAYAPNLTSSYINITTVTAGENQEINIDAKKVQSFGNFPGFSAGREVLMKYFSTSEGGDFLKQPGYRAALALNLNNARLSKLLYRY